MPAHKFTRRERRALLREALEGVVPAEAKKTKPVDPAVEWLPEFNELHKEGYSWHQLADASRHPKIALNLGTENLRKKAVAATAADTTANPAPPATPSDSPGTPTPAPTKNQAPAQG